ncbi:hypothetical protein BJ875DRAFT_543095 [Amylocarpus encephaloides]|uniref:Uncharacterized protein n=1 Tax=Amylocarpus encephaloides TaxID=45428 RepID=A0A9P8C5H3_9HELO|nr:hypothetical protein BJ875DRAFT_543095 [Amylocarpus encephaloides]
MDPKTPRPPWSARRTVFGLPGSDHESEIPKETPSSTQQRQPLSTKQSMATVADEADDESGTPTTTKTKPAARDLGVHMRALEKDIDRVPAKPRQHNSRKLLFKFRRQVNTPPGSSIWTLRDGEYFEYSYKHTVNWDDQESLNRLNNWRSHVIQRYCGDAICKKRVAWLMSEKKAVLTILDDHLKTHDKPMWNRIANRFNLEAAGTIQPAGSQKVGRDAQGNAQVRPATTLINRNAPWRPARTLEAAAYRWPEYKTMMEAHRNKRKTFRPSGEMSTNTSAVSDDDSELSDPGIKLDAKVLKASKVDMNKASREKIRAKTRSSAAADGYSGPAKLTSATDGSGPNQRHSRGWGNAIAREDPNESGLTTSSEETDEDIAARIGNMTSTTSLPAESNGEDPTQKKQKRC